MLQNLSKLLVIFRDTFENEKHITVQNIYVVNKEKAGNLLGIETAKELQLIDFKEKKINVNNITAEKKTNEQCLNDINCSQEFNSSIQKLVCEFSDIFGGMENCPINANFMWRKVLNQWHRKCLVYP